MKAAMIVGKYVKPRFFRGMANSAMTILAFGGFIALIIGAFISSGFSWHSFSTILIGLLLLVVLTSLNIQNYYLHSQLSQSEARSAKAISAGLDSKFDAIHSKLESRQATMDQTIASKHSDFEKILNNIHEELANSMTNNNSRVAQINEETFRAHREVNYILSQLRSGIDDNQIPQAGKEPGEWH